MIYFLTACRVAGPLFPFRKASVRILTLLLDFTAVAHHCSAAPSPATGNAQYLPAPVSQFGPDHG